MSEEIKEKIKAYYIANDIDKILNYITNLQQKVEQLENIRKEAIEWIDKHDYYSGSSDIYYFNDFTPSNDLLNILNKVDNNGK